MLSLSRLPLISKVYLCVCTYVCMFRYVQGHLHWQVHMHVSVCLCLCSCICGGQRTILCVILQAPATFFEIIIALFSPFPILPLTPPTHVSPCLLSNSWPLFFNYCFICLFPKCINATCSFLIMVLACL